MEGVSREGRQTGQWVQLWGGSCGSEISPSQLAQAGFEVGLQGCLGVTDEVDFPYHPPLTPIRCLLAASDAQGA